MDAIAPKERRRVGKRQIYVHLQCCSTALLFAWHHSFHTQKYRFFRQVENSRQMYRAIMEEVEKFLERCHHSFETIQHRTRTRAAVERSRSIANIMKATNASAIENRARSSINLTQDINKKTGFFFSEYNTFKDFTWWVEHCCQNVVVVAIIPTLCSRFYASIFCFF